MSFELSSMGEAHGSVLFHLVAMRVRFDNGNRDYNHLANGLALVFVRKDNDI